MAETMETEEVVELCREICREMVPNWDMGMGPRPGPWGTAAVVVEVGRGVQRKKVGKGE